MVNNDISSTLSQKICQGTNRCHTLWRLFSYSEIMFSVGREVTGMPYCKLMMFYQEKEKRKNTFGDPYLGNAGLRASGYLRKTL